MDKFLQALLKYKKTVVGAFIVLAFFCLIQSMLVKVNYNLMDYLPDEAPSTIALDEMNAQFSKGSPNARVMLHNVTIAEAVAIKNKIKEVDGVDEVTWLDDAENVYQPLEYIPQKTLDEYYVDNNALLTLTIDTDKKEEAVPAVRKIIGDDNAMSGTAVNDVTAITQTSKEINLIMVFVLLLVFLILLATTTSYFEPVLFLVTIGIAILINRGTNLFFGEISFVTNAACSVLQLAVSMDYSIFLVDRFEELRPQYNTVEEAMAEAIKKSFSSVMSSGLTTVIGFAALILMKFKIGPDMGIIMAKAIAISLVTVMVFLPAATLMCYKLIDKTTHKLFIPSFDKFGKIVTHWRRPILIVFLLVTIPCFLGQQYDSFIYGSSGIYGPGTKLGDDTQKIEDVFGKSNLMVVMVQKDSYGTEKQLADELLENDKVTSVISFAETVGNAIPTDFVPSDTLSQLVSDKYSRLVITVDTDASGDEAFKMVEFVKKTAQKYYGEKYLICGETVNSYDLKNTVTTDNKVVDFVSVLAIAIVLLFNFKSLTIPFILLAVIKSSVWINLSVPYFTGETIFYIGYLIIGSIQLGATVDYAILFMDRYIENRKDMNSKEATRKTLSDTSLSILTSSTILTSAGLMLGIVSSNGIISQLGILVGRGAILSCTLVIFVLPALIHLLDKVIYKTTYKLDFYGKKKSGKEN